jgi:hypothetical protein
MDPHAEAFQHAASGDWRAYPAYIDRLLDEHLAARTARDVADLEELYRAADGSPLVEPVRVVARPFDHGADWSTP